MRAMGVQQALAVRTVAGLALLTLLAGLARRFRLAAEALTVTVLVYGAVAVWHLLGPLGW